MLVQIAWRNIWRNKRRTLITIASIFFATLIALLTRSFQLGYYNNALNSIIEHFSGHIQIQQKDYFFNPSINNLLVYNDKLKQILDKNSKIKYYLPRLQSGVMVTAKNKSQFAIIIGVNPEKEKQFSQLDRKIAKFKIDSLTIQKLKSKIPQKDLQLIQRQLLGYYNSVAQLQKKFKYIDKNLLPYTSLVAKYSRIRGRYLKQHENSVIIGSKLADFFNVKVGDSIIVLGQGYHGLTAVGKFKIVGILNFPNPQFNQTFIYMPLRAAQQLFSAYEFDQNGDTLPLVSYVTVNTIYRATIRPSDYRAIEKVRNQLQKTINSPQVRVLGWHELNRQLLEQIQTDNISGQIMLIVLFIIIGLGVFGTILMMTLERRKEFAIQLAIGLRRGKLQKIILLEILFIAVVGILLAELVAVPIIFYGHYHPIYLSSPEIQQAYAMFNAEPIMPMELFGQYMLVQPLIVLVIIAITALYPVLFIKKLKIPNSLHF